MERIDELEAKLNAYSSKYIGLKEIMLIANCKQTKASQIMQEAKMKPNGTSKYNLIKVNRDVVLKLLNIDLDEELNIINQVINSLKENERKYENKEISC